MSLEQLQARRLELEKAIANTTQSLYVIQGHKQEVEFQISQLEVNCIANPEVEPVE